MAGISHNTIAQKMALTDAGTVTVALADWDTLRNQIGTAITKLEAKINEILNVQQLTCDNTLQRIIQDYAYGKKKK